METKNLQYSNIIREYKNISFCIYWKNNKGIITFGEILKFNKFTENSQIIEVESQKEALKFIENLESIKLSKPINHISTKTVDKMIKSFEIACEMLTKSKQFILNNEDFNFVYFICERYTTKSQNFILYSTNNYKYILTINDLAIYLSTENYIKLQSFVKLHYNWLKDIENNKTGTLEFVRAINEINKNK